jgi:hypothetical protein
MADKRSKAKAQRPFERYGNVDHQLKKARVVGMQAQAKKITLDRSQTKIQLLWENADVYRSVHGVDCYNKMLVALIDKMTGLEDNITETLALMVYSHSHSLDNDVDKDE